MERFVERFRYKATKARQAQSKLKQIERIRSGAIETDPRDRRTLAFSFGDAERSGRVVARARGRADRGRRPDADRRTPRCGSSAASTSASWARTARARRPCVETLVGERDAGAGEAAARPQRQARLPLPAPGGRRRRRTPPCCRTRSARPGSRRRRPGRCSGASCSPATTSPSALADVSGGEAQRLALALLTSSDANLLVLDEPTNHLDLESREALEDALTGFAGTVLLVSHDRALLEAVGSRTLVIEDRRLRSHPGGWAEYRSSVEERAGGRRRPRARRPRRGRRRAGGPSKNRKARARAARARGRGGRGRVQAARGRARRPVALVGPRALGARRRRATRRARAKLDELIARWEAAAERVEG